MLRIVYFFYLFGLFNVKCADFDYFEEYDSPHGLFDHDLKHLGPNYDGHFDDMKHLRPNDDGHFMQDHFGHSSTTSLSGIYNIPFSFLVLLMILSAFMSLIFLGILKGLIGVCCWAPIGMWSLGALIDLPRPLDRYQEHELSHYPVVYDQTGWPVHPRSGKRSVRALSKRTEFFLNTVFFLTYPIAVLISMCGACCFRETYQDDEACYKCVNTVVFNTCVNSASETITGETSTYSDEEESTLEQKDTEYVLEQMRSSRESLQVIVYNFILSLIIYQINYFFLVQLTRHGMVVCINTFVHMFAPLTSNDTSQ
ncbi:hypothetical protein FQR65_LT04503 [Abscondita terminalis]|nr:hypothetical protein FQR65_LT04503 [Abscondita terminalis]